MPIKRWIEVILLMTALAVTVTAGCINYFGELRTIAFTGREIGVPINDLAPEKFFSLNAKKKIAFAGPSTVFYLAGRVAGKNKEETIASVSPPVDSAVITIGSTERFTVSDGSGRIAADIPAGKEIKVFYGAGQYYLYNGGGLTSSSKNGFKATPTGSGIMILPEFTDWNWNKTVNLNQFKGSIDVRYSEKSGRLWAINELGVEDYLKGVSETMPGSPFEHLKTMAVVERSYAWHHLENGGKHKGEPFTLKNSRGGNGDDQIYQGYLAETRLPRIAAAADATKGRVVTYKGQAVITPYSSNPGGRTLTPKEAGWGNLNWPWVVSVPDPDTTGMPRNGHGVGLSGLGSHKRAERGQTAEQILKYYFPGTEIGAAPTSNRTIRIAIYGVPGG